jgi:predicted dehydrogenase
MNRRHFLMGMTAGVLRASPNDTVRVACVGLHGQGGTHIHILLRQPNVELAALCDVDERVLGQRLDQVEEQTGKRPAAFTDFRKLVEDKSIDAVSIATPNHHHTLQTLWAIEAGKDVYVEKPCTHNMFESARIGAARKKYNRIVQHGTQTRSSPSAREAIKSLGEGLIGDVYLARGLCFKWRNTIGHKPVAPVPPGVHYDLWLGPAPEHAFTENRFHYNWHWFWDYGNGDLGNQGIHQLDVARWGLGVEYPTKVTAIGGHFMFDDDQETPNTLTALYEFNDATGKKKMLEFAVRHWITNREAEIGEGTRDRNTMGDVFYGSKGYLTIDASGKYATFLGPEREPGPTMKQSGDHFANFLAAVRSRKQEDLNAPVEEGAKSCVLIHLANISYRLGRTLAFDPANWSCPGDEEATRKLQQAFYRAPFTVPEKI